MDMKVEHKGPDDVRVMKVIRVICKKGNGTSENPVRYVYQYWDFKGNLLAECDEWKENNYLEETKSSAVSDTRSYETK